jgi:hypothetical protein
MITDGAIIWGTGEIRPITNMPQGVLKIRIRQRVDACTTVFLKFKDRIEQWQIEPDGDDWRLDFPFRRNGVRT